MSSLPANLAEVTAVQIAALLSASPEVGDYLRIVLDNMVELRAKLSPETVADEHVALLQGCGTSIAVIWGMGVRNKTNPKYLVRQVESRLQLFISDVTAINELLYAQEQAAAAEVTPESIAAAADALKASLADDSAPAAG